MAGSNTVKLTANFERNLQEAERFLLQAQAPQAFDALLDELTQTVIPNLERFPGMGRPFLDRSMRSVEASNRMDQLQAKFQAIAPNGEIHEYVMKDYLLMYARINTAVDLLSIRHHRQLSFDLPSFWQTHL
jgi:plasmid stabilization system protein ParE